jgi:chromosome segregation ATPase
VAEDLFQTLMRFHREVTIPDMQRLVREPLEDKIEALRTDLRSEMLSGFDGVYKKIGILETEMVLMRGAVRDLEKEVAGLNNRLTAVESRLTSIEEKVDRLALRSEVAELKEQVETIQQRIAEIETLLNEH